MKTKILPISLGFPQPQEVTDIDVTVRFDLGAKTSQSYWVLSNEKGEAVQTGNLDIPEEVHAKWGIDDTLVLDYILEQLGLEKQATTLD
jgi:hypothetical protein